MLAEASRIIAKGDQCMRRLPCYPNRGAGANNYQAAEDSDDAKRAKRTDY